MPETTTAPPPAATTEAAPAAETTTTQAPPAESQTVDAPKKDGADEARTALMSDDNFWGRILGPREEPSPDKGDAQEEPKDDNEKPEAEPAKPEKPEKPEKPKKAAAKVEPPAAEPKKVIKRSEPDIDRIVTTATTAATKAAIASLPQQAPISREPIVDDNAALLQRLDEDAREDANELIEMERINPRKYTGLLKKFVDYKAKEADLIKKWQKANPGQAFNREDEAHDEFYAENEPEISEVDRRKAQREIVRREARQEMESVVAPIKQRAESEERIRQIEPAIRNVQMNALGYMLTVVKPEAKELLNEEGGYVKMKESDPEAVEIAESEFARVRPLLVETVKIYGNAVRPDPANNPIHKAFIDAVLESENQISQLPIKDQIRNGAAFARLADFVKMSAAEQKQHWTVQQEEVLSHIASSAAGRALEIHKKESERYEKWAERRGYKPNPASKTTPAKKVEAAAKASNGAPATPPPASPSGSGRIQVDTNATKPEEEDGGFRKWFGTGMRPR